MQTDPKIRYDQLLDFVDLLYQAKNHQSISQCLFSNLQQFVGFDMAIFTPINWQTLELQSAYYHGEMPEQNSFIPNLHAPFDALIFDPLCLTRLNSSIRLSDLAVDTKLNFNQAQGSKFFDHYFHAMGVLASWRQQPVAAIRLYRTAQQHDFSEQDRLLLNRVAVHLANALYLQDTTSTLEPLRETGLLVFDQEANIIYKNEAVNIMLAGLELNMVLTNVQNGHLWLRNGSELYRTEIVPLTNTSLLSTLAKTEGIETSTDLLPKAQSITIISIEPFRRRHAIGNRLKQSGLSQREIDVSLGIMRGLSNSNIAKQLFIDEKTVKDHLQRIYAKIHIKTRTELISKLLGLDIELADHSGNNQDEVKEE